VIRGVAVQIHSCISPDDVLFRWGGEEFLLVLPGVDLASALNLGGRIGGAVSRVIPQTNPHTSDPPTVTVSIGVTEWRTDDGADAMLERADRALYRAKQSGRNRVVTG
jgi:diguanylate cyclase (GGDEF)-like protein